MNPYREAAPVPPPPPRPHPKDCIACHRENVRVGFLRAVSGTYGAGDEKYRYHCDVCGDVWD